jgi:hypothetical protein
LISNDFLVGTANPRDMGATRLTEQYPLAPRCHSAKDAPYMIQQDPPRLGHSFGFELRTLAGFSLSVPESPH